MPGLVDFSLIPKPDIIEQISFETILTALKTEILIRDPALTAVELESEPLAKLLQTFAYRETVIRQRVNDGGHAVMLAYAVGTDLDNLGAFYGITRIEISPENLLIVPPVLAVFESDSVFRERIRLALYARTTAGAKNTYKFYALGADPEVLDVGVTSPFPGRVIVTVLARSGTGIPSIALLATVLDAINADDIRPLTDDVAVQAVEILSWSVQANLTLYPGADPVTVVEASRNAVIQLGADNFRLGRDITRAMVIGAIMVGGVQNANLITPAVDLVITGVQAQKLGAVVLTVIAVTE